MRKIFYCFFQIKYPGVCRFSFDIYIWQGDYRINYGMIEVLHGAWKGAWYIMSLFWLRACGHVLIKIQWQMKYCVIFKWNYELYYRSVVVDMHLYVIRWDRGSHYNFVLYISFFQSFSNDIGGLPKELADRVALLPELLKYSRASSTVKSYHSGFVRWKNWALINGLGSKDVLPAKAFHVALYLASVIQTAESASPVIKAFYSIKWFHDMFDLVSPTTSSLVLNILESAKRRLARPVRKKEHITTELLTKMFHSLYVAGNAKNQRTICRGHQYKNRLWFGFCDIMVKPVVSSVIYHPF